MQLRSDRPIQMLETAMWKRLLIGILIVTAGLLALVLTFPDRSTVLLGLIRHDAMFAGKPTSYWIRALKQPQPAGPTSLRP